ncbi:MAG: hypothetical protein HYV26_09365 [Candidatus Hydrogenedentes bacterium]|nr:hypothetical protein [Candidatus Hydrogenedentota bacterium]
MDGRWVVQFRSGDGRIPMPNELWSEDGFYLELDHQPLLNGWRWDGLPVTTDAGNAKEIAVRLLRDEPPLEVALHTLLDGTPVLTRWLEITNRGDTPLPVGTIVSRR